MSAPDLATQVSQAGASPSRSFNKREQKILESVKTYVDAQAAGQNQLSELTDTAIATPASGQVLVYDGTNSWDNKSVSGDATMAASGALTIANSAVTNAKLGADAVDNSKLADASVSLEQLDTGITFAYAAKFAGSFTTAGGDTAESIPAAGVLGTDTVMVMVQTPGAVPVYVTAATAATDAVSVTLSADPSNDHVLQYVVFRATT